MRDNGVVELTLPSGKTVKLESIKALQALVEGKADASSVEEIKTALEKKADTTSVEEISKTVANKLNKNSVIQENGSADDKIISQKVCTDTFAKKISSEAFSAGKISTYHPTGDSIFFIGGNKNTVYEIIYAGNSKRCFVRNNATGHVIYFPLKIGEFALTSDIPKMIADSNGFFKNASPLIKIHPDGSFETNDESEGAKVKRIETGKYLNRCDGI
ncbi:MAG: hypothetical protein AB8W32_10885 [Arsenophonus endosymbiont of Dermacentor nuttalli]